MDCPHLLRLPEEVLLNIFEYADAVSKLELSKVCTVFWRLYQDRDVIKKLNFSRNYKTSLAHFKIQEHRPIYKLVTHLNIRSIYWIQSAQLRYVLLKFTGLIYLNVMDTQLTFRDLSSVLSTAKKVVRLAISLKFDNCCDVAFTKLKLQLTHLYIQFSSLRELAKLLSNFRELEELWLIEPNKPASGTRYDPEFLLGQYPDCVMPKVRSLLVLTRGCSVVGQIACLRNELNQLKTPGNWVTLVEQQNPTYFVLEKFDENIELAKMNKNNTFERKLIYLYNDVGLSSMFAVEDLQKQLYNRFSYSLVYYNSLNMTRCVAMENESSIDLDKCVEALNVILLARNTSRIRKLKMENMFVWNKKTITEIYLPLFKKPRIGSGSTPLCDKSLFARMTKNLTEMEDFELINKCDYLKVGKDNSKWEWQSDSLKYISNWKMLNKLTLTMVPFKNGNFFTDIMKNCPNLKCLKIQDDAIPDKISLDLCLGLAYAKNLQDLRYERNGAIPIDTLFEALTRCKKLERLYVQCRETKMISKKPLETLLFVCDKLVFFIIYITELLETVCKTIKQSISSFDIKPGQIFDIRGRCYNLSSFSFYDVPHIHIEMVCQSNESNDFLQSF